MLGQNNDTGNGRIDWNLNANNNMFGRFSRQDTLTNTPSTFGFRTVPGLSIPVSLGNNGNYAGRAPMSNYNGVIAFTHLFSPTFLVDMRMGYSRFDMHNVDSTAPTSGPGLGQLLGIPNSNQEPESLGFPIIAINNYTGIGGPAAIPTIRIENTFNPVVNFTKTMGRHTLKWGASLVRRQITDFQDNSGNGSYTFDSTFDNNPNSAGNTGNAMARLPARGTGRRHSGLSIGLGWDASSGVRHIRGRRLARQQPAHCESGTTLGVSAAAGRSSQPLCKFQYSNRQGAHRRL